MAAVNPIRVPRVCLFVCQPMCLSFSQRGGRASKAEDTEARLFAWRLCHRGDMSIKSPRDMIIFISITNDGKK